MNAIMSRGIMFFLLGCISYGRVAFATEGHFQLSGGNSGAGAAFRVKKPLEFFKPIELFIRLQAGLDQDNGYTTFSAGATGGAILDTKIAKLSLLLMPKCESNILGGSTSLAELKNKSEAEIEAHFKKSNEMVGCGFRLGAGVAHEFSNGIEVGAEYTIPISAGVTHGEEHAVDLIISFPLPSLSSIDNSSRDNTKDESEIPSSQEVSQDQSQKAAQV